MTKYTLTDEHRAQLPAWRDKWITNAMSTVPMTDADREHCARAVHGMYEAANLPPPKAVVFVPSPFVMTFAGGFAAAIWHRRHNGMDVTPAVHVVDIETRRITQDITSDSTRFATRYTVDDLDREIVFNAALSLQKVELRAAILDATHDITGEAAAGIINEAWKDAGQHIADAAIGGAATTAIYKAVGVRDYKHIRGVVYHAVNLAVSAAAYDAVEVAMSDAIYDALAVDAAYEVDETVSEAAYDVRDKIGTAVYTLYPGAGGVLAVGNIREATYTPAVDATQEAVRAATDPKVNNTTESISNRTLNSLSLLDEPTSYVFDMTKTAVSDVVVSSTLETTSGVMFEATDDARAATDRATDRAVQKVSESDMFDAVTQSLDNATRDETLDGFLGVNRRDVYNIYAVQLDAQAKASDDAAKAVDFGISSYNRRDAIKGVLDDNTAAATDNVASNHVYTSNINNAFEATHRTITHQTLDAALSTAVNPISGLTMSLNLPGSASGASKGASAPTPPSDLTWYQFDTAAMHRLSHDLGLGDFGLACAQSIWRIGQGGNQWSAWDSYLTFFRDVVGLKLPEYDAYKHYSDLSELSGPRLVHADFCMISDRPELLTVDEQNRPHNETGPFCRWRDGSALYAIHGVRVPAWVVLHHERITVDSIHKEDNTEVQRVMIERFGWDRYADECGAVVLDHDERYGTLMKGPGGLFLRVVNRSPEPDGSFRNYILPVMDNCEPLPDPMDPNGELGEAQALTARNAVASTFGMTGEEYEAVLGGES